MTITTDTKKKATLRERGYSRGQIRAMKIGGLAAFLVIWQIAGSAKPDFYSSPTRVLSELRYQTFEGELIPLTIQSGITMFWGLTLAMLVGVTLGFLLGVVRPFSVAFEPWLVAFYSIPTVPWIPLIVIWWGIDRQFAIVVVIAGTSIQLAFSTAAGMRLTKRQFREVAAAYEIGGWTMFAKVLLPGAIPFIGGGMRLAIKHAFTAVLIAEYLVGLSGLGMMIRGARESLATDLVFASAIATMIVGFTLIAISVAIERRLQRWKPVAF